ncbi:unnamed protein product [Merluccius merluccius]
MSDQPDGASAPRRHARRVTSTERLPPLTYDAESSPLLAASSLLIAADENASLAAAFERTSLNATKRAPLTAPGRCCVYSHH